MKNKLLPFVFAAMFSACIWALCADEQKDVQDIWSGKEQVLPGSGKWELLAAHGRVLASGNGDVKLNIPELDRGTFLDAELVLDGVKNRIRIWSTKILSGYYAEYREDSRRLRHIFLDHGVTPLPLSRDSDIKKYVEKIKNQPEIVIADHYAVENGKLVMVFPDKRDFPVAVGDKWVNLSLNRAKIPGSLSVLMEKREQILDNRGDCSYAVLAAGKTKVVVFSQDFDFKKIENILLIKKILEENSK